MRHFLNRTLLGNQAAAPPETRTWWAIVDSNHRPQSYQDYGVTGMLKSKIQISILGLA